MHPCKANEPSPDPAGGGSVFRVLPRGGYTVRKRTVPFGSRLRVLLIVNGLCVFVFAGSQWQAFNPYTFALFEFVQIGESIALYRTDANRPW
jgi:hypothetical protein